jgi:hypothetical protein
VVIPLALFVGFRSLMGEALWISGSKLFFLCGRTSFVKRGWFCNGRAVLCIELELLVICKNCVRPECWGGEIYLAFLTFQTAH